MRALILIFTFLSYSHTWAKTATPRVPATIEIAGVKLKITAEAQRDIQKDVDALRASDKYFQIKLDRVNLYFPLIEKTLKEEGVPDDLKYLAVQESALVSDAVSSADAVGFWQFKDFTAREVGLRVDSKVDERKNIISSTRGASVYFKRNNYFLKNWIYVVNAHMTGPTGVKKYIDEKEIGSDRMVISGKTHWYVKRFIAYVIAFKDEVGAPNSDGLKLVIYTKGKNKTLSEIAREVKIDESMLKEYNKWLKHGKIPDDRDYAVIVPVNGKVPAGLKDGDTDHAPPPLSRKIEEPIAKSNQKLEGEERKNVFITRNDRRAIMADAKDNVVSLSEKANILSRQLIKFNDLSPVQTINEGEVYYAQSKKNKSDIPFHVAQQNESLWEISQNYGVKMKQILKKNRMNSADELQPGRLLWLRDKRPKDVEVVYKNISKTTKTEKAPVARKPVLDAPIPKPIVVEPIVEPIEESNDNPETQEGEETEVPLASAMQEQLAQHEVQSGESLWGISRLYNVTVENLQKWNAFLEKDGLQPGQILTVNPDSTSEKSNRPEAVQVPKTHTVAPGESLWRIGQLYNLSTEELKALNNKTSNELAVGEVLKLE